MPDAPFTEAEVERLIVAQKFVYKTLEDNRGQPNINEVRLTYEIRERGREEENLHLRLYARLEKQPYAGGIKPQPGVVLFWYDERIRGVCWRLRHDSILNGKLHNVVRYWHEKQWTDSDRDTFVVDANPFVKKGTDFKSLIRICAERWHIEIPDHNQLEIEL